MGEAKRRRDAALSSDHWPGGESRCPRCLGLKVAKTETPSDLTFHGRVLAICTVCEAIWEPIKETDIWDRTDPYCCGKEPCDNCAFRPGSPEQADTQKWGELIASLKAGGTFYCHKGVPINHKNENGFDYPSDRRKLRLCRGYLNALGQWWKLDKKQGG